MDENGITVTDTIERLKAVDYLHGRLVDDASGGRGCDGSDAKWVGGCYANVTDVHYYPDGD